MRDIKFRLWDKEYGEIWEYDELMIMVLDEELSVSYDTGSEYKEFDNYEITQYTGLKDIKGKEIYEGDIVDFYSNVEDEVITEKVDYSFGMYRAGDYHLGKIFEKCEIIGNIYENPELLTD